MPTLSDIYTQIATFRSAETMRLTMSASDLGDSVTCVNCTRPLDASQAGEINALVLDILTLEGEGGLCNVICPCFNC